MKGRGERTYSMKEEDVSPLLVEVAGEGPAGLAALEEGDGRHGGQGQGGPAGFLDSMYGMAASYFSKTFMSGCGILFPLIITVYATWWLLQFFDDFFSPIYQSLFGFHVFGLGFITSMAFIFLTGLLGSSWLGQLLLWGGEVIVAKVPFVSSIYSATKQIGNAMNPSKDSSAFQELVIIKHHTTPCCPTRTSAKLKREGRSVALPPHRPQWSTRRVGAGAAPGVSEPVPAPPRAPRAARPRPPPRPAPCSRPHGLPRGGAALGRRRLGQGGG